MRPGTVLVVILGSPWISSCGSDPAVQICCSTGPTSVLRDTACLAGEITQPVDRCMPRDAGNLCGNGLYESALEQCDPTSPLAPTCSGGKSCNDCMCTASACGDNVVGAGEQCELTSQCPNPAASACRACACVFRQMPAIFTDAMGNDSTPPGKNLVRVEMSLKAPPADSFEILTTADGLSRPGRAELCLVIMDGVTEAQRMCLRQDNDATPVVYLKSSAAGERLLALQTEYSYMRFSSQGDTGQRVVVQSSVGLRFERALSFHWESSYDGTLADRLPDTGEISFTEIMGRE